jgi:hypothetical protein
MSPNKKKPKIGKGFYIQSQTKDVILNLKKFFEETEKNLNEKEIREKIAEATTFSSKTVQRIFVNGNESPKKTKNREAVFTWVYYSL